MSKISKRWSAHLKTEQDKRDFEAMVREASPVLERLSELLKKEVEGINASIKGYEFLVLPGSKERLINRLAAVKKLEDVIELIEV